MNTKSNICILAPWDSSSIFILSAGDHIFKHGKDVLYLQQMPKQTGIFNSKKKDYINAFMR